MIAMCDECVRTALQLARARRQARRWRALGWVALACAGLSIAAQLIAAIAHS